MQERKSPSFMARYIVVIILLVAASIANYSFSRSEAKLVRRDLDEFPRVIGDWRTIDEYQIGERSMAVLQVDDYLIRTYINEKGKAINLYMGYFANQREGKRIHSPRQCLPGSGWAPLRASIRRLSLPGHNSVRLPVNEYLMAKGGEKELYLFWYQGRGRTYASEYLNKLYLVWDAMTRSRTDGALLRISMSVADSPERSMESLVDFIGKFFPVLPQFVPE